MQRHDLGAHAGRRRAEQRADELIEQDSAVDPARARRWLWEVAAAHGFFEFFGLRAPFAAFICEA